MHVAPPRARKSLRVTRRGDRDPQLESRHIFRRLAAGQLEEQGRNGSGEPALEASHPCSQSHHSRTNLSTSTTVAPSVGARKIAYAARCSPPDVVASHRSSRGFWARSLIGRQHHQMTSQSSVSSALPSRHTPVPLDLMLSLSGKETAYPQWREAVAFAAQRYIASGVKRVILTLIPDFWRIDPNHHDDPGMRETRKHRATH